MILRLFNFVGLLVYLAAFPGLTDADETGEAATALDVPISSLTNGPSPLYFWGHPLDSSHPGANEQRVQAALKSSEEFGRTKNCLSFRPADEAVSLARLNTHQFDQIEDLEICLQRIASNIDDVSGIRSWLASIGFQKISIQPQNTWISPYRPKFAPGEISVLRAQWRGPDTLFGRRFPLNPSYNAGNGLLAKNMVLTLVIRQDFVVIDTNVTMIYL
ncbi:MAG: hypothetical protein GY768_29280 [Planctomycetaceae bacterium]|nr:hypothetical protein [Planctomycetaceae bacterium]